MDRILLVDREIYMSLIEAFRPQQRVIVTPPAELWNDDLKKDADIRFPMGIHLIARTPEGDQHVIFMRRKP